MLATFRIRKDRDYVVIHNDVLLDKRLSWKAKGVLAYLLSKPNDWVVRITDIRNKAKEGDKAVRGAIQELLDGGYLSRRIVRDEGKRFSSFEYDVYESPCLNPGLPDRVKSYNRLMQEASDRSLKEDVEGADLGWSEDMREH